MASAQSAEAPERALLEGPIRRVSVLVVASSRGTVPAFFTPQAKRMLPTARPRLLTVREGLEMQIVPREPNGRLKSSRQAGEGPRLSPAEVLNEVMRLSATPAQASMQNADRCVLRKVPAT